MTNTLGHLRISSGIETNMDAISALSDQALDLRRTVDIHKFRDAVDQKDDELRERQNAILKAIKLAGPKVKSQLYAELDEVINLRDHYERLDDRARAKDNALLYSIVTLWRSASNALKTANALFEEAASWLTKTLGHARNTADSLYAEQPRASK